MGAAIKGTKNMGLKLAQTLIINRGIGNTIVKTRDIKGGNLGKDGQARGRDIVPMLAAIFGAPDKAIIRADPDLAGMAGRGGDLEDRAIAAGRRVGDGDL